VNRLPLRGKNPLSLPELVPIYLTRTATMSSSATMDSILTLRSGNWLPEAVATPAHEFITGQLLLDPHRIGKRLLPPMDDRFSARRGTTESSTESTTKLAW